MSAEIIIALIVVFAIPAWFFGGIMLKLLWGWWAVPLFPVLGAWRMWENGMESFIWVPVGILAGIVVTWLWQITPMFVKGDRFISKMTMID